MNPWTALVIGLVLGWLIQFVIDWFFWQRKRIGEEELDALRGKVAAAEARVIELETGAADEIIPAPADIDYEAGEITDEEWPVDSEITVGEAMAVEEIAGTEGEPDGEGGWDLGAAELAAAGAAAAVVAGAGDDTMPEEIEKAPADELDEELAAAFAGQSDLAAEFDSADEEFDFGEGEFDSADGEFASPGGFAVPGLAAAGLAAAAIAGAGDDITPDESEMELTADFDEEAKMEAAAEEFDGTRVTGAAATTRDLSYIEGIGQVYAGKLKELGIMTPQALLEKGATPKGRKELAEQTGISGVLILRWVNHVDLFRIKGLGAEYADLLEASGVDTVPELAMRNPQHLYQRVIKVNEEKRLVRQAPSQSQIENWVSQAKNLPRVITY